MKKNSPDQLTEYAKYILTNDSYDEQIKLVKNIDSVFVIRNRKLEVS